MRTVWTYGSVLAAADMVSLVNGCDTIALLRSALGVPGDEVNVRGALVPGDGGDGSFVWSAADGDADDGVFTILPSTGTGLGRWKRIVSGPTFNAAWWGIDSSGVTPSDSALQAADSAAALAGVDLEIAFGVIRLSQSYQFKARLIVASGARIRPDSSVTLTLLDTPAIAHNDWIFDLTFGGSVTIARPSRPVIVSWWGAMGRAIVASINVSITAGQNSLVATTALWTSADLGKAIIVPGAGDPGGTYLSELHTTIQLVSVDGKTVTLASNAGMTVSNASATRVIYGYDETTQIQAALRCSSAGLPVEADFPPGNYLHQFGQPVNATLGLVARAFGRARIIGITPSAPSAIPIFRFTGAATYIEHLVFEATNGTLLPVSVAARSALQAASFTVIVGVKDYYIDPTSGAVVATLPPMPITDDEYFFKDSTGQAATHAIGLNGNGYSIDGQATIAAFIQEAYGFGRVKFNGTNWSVAA